MEAAEAVIVVKIGGSTLGNQDTTLEDLVALQRRHTKVVVVHGGGSIISQWMKIHGTMPKFVKGLRATDASSLDIVTAVLAGLVNKKLVASVIRHGGKALGISGIDGATIQARLLDPDMGYVGDIVHVETGPIDRIMVDGHMPFVAPLGIHCLDDSDRQGCILNINADTAAGEIAVAMKAKKMVFLTDVAGVLDTSGRQMSKITGRQGQALLNSGIIKGGMLPKLKACIRAASHGTQSHIIDGRRPAALRDCLDGKNIGTIVR